ncbi:MULTISPECIES: chemotaxis protein [Klebsiella pneumoniae complex]|uniref:chemotaxis protein n=1 Tax=Klebsiella pneumoniae complex TaxID=3390273 RepID=UPI0010834ED4|nr:MULTISPECIES: chemotaxis protein [Klebsiella]MDE1587649.1 chemotaxis protein [Klebsiella quasipneumoniae]MDE1594781.1 chemotaxis protein [Klebsiella quasipneumoniae]MDE1603613.1 chemotaxis protein [Klebsiella quasipneumoniae]MDE1605489.1 chemotaxis protein [Klebsiella quasipneumoniae]MDE1614356.1 chemotaxis protein [Klebsiella quasipneumoniae]
MSNGNIIVSTLTNRVEWLVDESSYKRALKRIKSLKSAHEKPAKALEAAQKRTAQSEGKAALAAAKAQTAKLRQAKQISTEQQKQAQLSAKVAQQEQAHAKKMAAINARGAVQQINQADQLAKQNERLARISAKVRAAARSRSMTYNPSMGGTAPEPGLLAAQTAAMNRGHASITNDIIQTKKAIALEEKRQREKEASLKRQSTAYDTLRRASLTISHIEGASLADKMKAVQAIKEATKGYSEQRYTIAEMRHELAKATLETRRQARLNRQIVKDKAKAERAGRINAGRMTRERSERGYGGLAATGVIAGGSLIGSMGVARVGQTLQGSLERSRDVKKLEQYGISNLEFAALQDLSMSRVGYSLSADKLADLNKDTTEKAGELLNTGSFKRNRKTGQVNFSGGGEFADIINNVLASTNGNQKVAQKVIGELQKLNFPTFITYLKQLQKTFKWTDNQTRHLAEAVNDGSVFLEVFNDEGQGLINRMQKLSAEGWTLSDAQQANLDKLAALGAEYNRVQTSLSDHFSSAFVNGLQDYATNTDTLRQSMTGLIPIADNLGQSLGELTTNVIAWASQIGGELQKGATLPTAIYNTTVDEGSNAAAQWIKDKTGFDPRVIGQTLKKIYPWLDSSAQNNIGSGQAWTNPGLTRGVAGFSQPQLTFTPPEPFGSTGWRPDSSRFNLTGEATVKVEVEQTLNAGVLDNLIDTKINDNNVRQQNMILGIAD